MSSILGIGASPRAGGNSDVLLKAVLDAAAEAGARTESVLLRRYQFSSCVGCEACRKAKACVGLNDGMSLLYPMIEASRGLALVTPVHNYNMSALLKAFIDRLYCYYDFTDERPRGWSSRLAGQGRKAVLLCVGEQEEEENLGVTMEAMRLPMKALGFDVLGELPLLRVFDRGKVREREEAMSRARELGARLARALETEPGE